MPPTERNAIKPAFPGTHSIPIIEFIAANQCGDEVMALMKTAEKTRYGILEAMERLSLARHPINDTPMVDRPGADTKNESVSRLQTFECLLPEVYFDMTIASGSISDVESRVQKLACPISMLNFSPPNAKTESIASSRCHITQPHRANELSGRKFRPADQDQQMFPETRAAKSTDSLSVLQYDQRYGYCFWIWLPSQTEFRSKFDIFAASGNEPLPVRIGCCFLAGTRLKRSNWL
jgi:hypothetical protein